MTRVTALARRLSGGNRRSTGAADAVAAEVGGSTSRFARLWDLLGHSDPLVRMRASDALEKASRDRPELLAPYRAALVSGALDDGTPEVRWHLIEMTARLELTADEAAGQVKRCRRAARTDPSRIVRAAALEAAHTIAGRHRALVPDVNALLTEAARSDIPSLSARARRLISGAARRS